GYRYSRNMYCHHPVGRPARALPLRQRSSHSNTIGPACAHGGLVLAALSRRSFSRVRTRYPAALPGLREEANAVNLLAENVDRLQTVQATVTGPLAAIAQPMTMAV
ncbi:MAG TPA: hypothetical protein VMX14_00665, partial [Anaerolineae bacterium]|nr:hypothetical protein [Anaerolineae bacterium]